MSRPILSRPRTRVYGCNYDKGESYYKPMVDHLDRKYSSRPLFSEPRNSIADEIAARRNDIGSRELGGPSSRGLARDGDLQFDSRHKPSAPLQLDNDEDTVFDVRGNRTRRSRLADEFADQVANSTRRFKARVEAIRQEDSLFGDSGKSKLLSSNERFSSFGDKFTDFGDEATTAFKRRAKQLVEEIEERPTLTRWSKFLDGDVKSSDDLGAASRARQTKARLNDLESEMEEMAERKAKREKRAAALRALVSDTASDDFDSSTALSSSKKSVSIKESSEKHVSF